MTRAPIIRILCPLVAVLIIAGAALSASVALDRRPPAVEAAVPEPVPPPHATPSTSPPEPTPTVPPPPTTVPATTVPATTVPATTTVPPTTVPPTTVPATTTVPPTIAPTTTIPTRSGPVGTLWPGDSGTEVLALQRRLRDLGYWLGEPDGGYGMLTEQAATAFQKVEGLTPDGVAGPATRAALAAARRPASSASGDMIEVDKGRQILFVVHDGAVAWTLNTSTGTETPYQVDGRTELADTPPGRWKVSWVVDGIDVGALGGLYRPRYFHPDGIAVHGYHSVPAYPASHGCVRVSEPAMDWIWAAGLLPVGSTVWVH